MSSRPRRLAKTRRMQRLRRYWREKIAAGEAYVGIIDLSAPASQTNTIGDIRDLPEKWWHAGPEITISVFNRKAT